MKARWFVPLLVAAICWGGAFACLRALPEKDTVSLRYAPSSLRPAVAQAVAGDRAFVLWQEEEQQALVCPELRRQVSAKVIPSWEAFCPPPATQRAAPSAAAPRRPCSAAATCWA